MKVQVFRDLKRTFGSSSSDAKRARVLYMQSRKQDDLFCYLNASISELEYKQL